MAKCKVCNRKITNSQSVKRQMGETCYKKRLAGYRGIQTVVPVSRQEDKEQKRFLKRLQQSAQK